MCPAMIAEPVCPGRGLPVYQPATEVLAGTWRVSWAVRPSLIRRGWTSMGGMDRDTGRATPPPPARRWGGAAPTAARGRAGGAGGLGARAAAGWYRDRPRAASARPRRRLR